MSQQPETAPAGFELGTDGPTAILVGFDGSDPSWRALHYAVGLARRLASRVIAVYAHHFPRSPTAAPRSACARSSPTPDDSRRSSDSAGRQPARDRPCAPDLAGN
ncbi:MAG: universal stress protein [Streptosporangiaceae bacterium]|jgi:nucleotide-binding universal stress UspA family protein